MHSLPCDPPCPGSLPGDPHTERVLFWLATSPTGWASTDSVLAALANEPSTQE